MSEKVADYTFTCPVCEETLAVNESMRRALIERGCVICGTMVTPSAFTDDARTDSA